MTDSGGVSAATLQHLDDFDGLLAASGLVGAASDGSLELPTRMASVNAMLDVASPAIREALLIAFLDRLSRPTFRSDS
jgi:sphinganine-1-phosphate aldolase